jgi:hypothetical protein
LDPKVKLPPGMKPGVKIEKYDRFGNVVQSQAPGIKFIEIRFKGRSLIIDRYMNVSLSKSLLLVTF